MSKWLQLSEGIFLFGNGGINRIEPIDKRNGIKTPYNTVLYASDSKITVVKETTDEIHNLLVDNKNQKE